MHRRPTPPVDTCTITLSVFHAVCYACQVIFKSGDDLRQDQLIMQMISLMDSLLKRVNLDLRCTTAVTLLLLGVPESCCVPLSDVYWRSTWIAETGRIVPSRSRAGVFRAAVLACSPQGHPPPQSHLSVFIETRTTESVNEQGCAARWQSNPTSQTAFLPPSTGPPLGLTFAST